MPSEKTCLGKLRQFCSNMCMSDTDFSICFTGLPQGKLLGGCATGDHDYVLFLLLASNNIFEIFHSPFFFKICSECDRKKYIWWKDGCKTNARTVDESNGLGHKNPQIEM